MLRPLIGGSILLALTSASAARAQNTYTSADRNFTFSYLDNWKVDSSGNVIRIQGPDGSRFTLSQDLRSGAAAADPANAPALRTAAETLAKTLLVNPEYAGVRPLTVDAGSGAIYRFRGRGKVSNNDLAEVWFGVVGNHTVTLLPDSAPQPDHYYELSTLFRSLSFADAPKGGARAGGGKRHGTQTGTESGNKTAAAGAPGLRTATGRRAQAAESAPALLGGYTGHLRPADVSFTLKLNTNRTASAEWTAILSETSHLTGTYTGDDGNYVVTLNQTSGSNPLGAKTITLYLRGLGGEEVGQFTTDTSSAHRPISDLKLTTIEGDHIRFRGTSGRNMRKR